VSEAELVALLCCDLGGIVRGRSVFASGLGDHLEQGIGWVPANQALTPLGPVAEPNPFGSTGDLRLLPDASTRVRVPGAEDGAEPLEFLLCDIVETDGSPWRCCTRSLLRETLADIELELGLSVLASFEHEFQLLREDSSALPFSLEAQRRGEPFATRVMIALREAGADPERFFPEYASHQFEIPVAPARGLEAADRAIVLREVVREVARREGERATFVPLLDPEEAGNGVHVHMSLSAADGGPARYDATREGCLSQLGGSFAAGILAHAPALSALTAPSPVSAPRLQPHRWSAGAACLAVRNREALLRIPPLLSLAGAEAAGQMRLEYRGADSAANPYLALAAILQAGLDGVRRGLPAPAILDRDPEQLSTEESKRFGVGALPSSLEEAMAALEEDERATSWLPPMLLEAYTSIKRYELEAATRLDLGEICRRYAAVY
jgi:glutamine synthetase